MVGRVDNDLPSDWRLLPWAASQIIADGGMINLDPRIDLYDGTDGENFNWNRVDELIIGLYEKLNLKNRYLGDQ